MSPTTQPQPLPLPEALNPDALDVLSELASLLTRLRTLPSTSSTGPSASGTPSQSQTHAVTAAGTPTPTALLLSGAKKPAGAELTLKEIPAATDALRHRFQRARALALNSLPDLDRTIADQEREIAALEARITRQRETLAGLRDVGAQLAVGQQEGEVEGLGDVDKMEE